MYMIEQKCSLWKVFQVFVAEPTKTHYIKEISRKVKLAPTSVRIHLKELEKQNFIIKEKDRFPGFKANRENQEFLFYKSMDNLIQLKKSGVLERITEKIHPKAIVLLGSYQKGEDIEESDIDLFISTKVKKDLELNDFESKLKRKIHLLQGDLSNLNKELRSEIINGMILYGYLE